ncbi:MAG TPA: immunoglobulin domain-containing protein [Verrucomicrobiae bacterium]
MITPQNAVAIPGSTVSFGVTTVAFPAVTSGTLQLWLRADAGAVTNSGGYLSEWVDQSSNANNAFQTNSSEQPFVENPPAIFGLPAVRFNGIQVDGVGDYLSGTNNVGLSGDFTSFLMYEMDSDSPPEQMAAFFGVPGIEGEGRGYWIPYGDMAFVSWSDDYDTGYNIPAGTYRIWTQRFNMGAGLAQLYDDTTSGTLEFDENTSRLGPVGPGFTVGGMNPDQPSVVNGRNFGGDIAELIIYKGALTDQDRTAVINYLEQKYYYNLQSFVSFQWQFDGVNIAGQTACTLTLTNVSTAMSGTYTALATNASGQGESVQAVLYVGLPPAIIAQPQSQSVGAGSNAVFSVTASGTDLACQWFDNSSPLEGQTGAALTVSNVTPAQLGEYQVSISNGFGAITSVLASLSIVTQPNIEAEPQGENVIEGNTASLTVSVSGTQSAYALPNVTSGTLDLWLRADAGVQTTGSNQVSEWDDQSGNNNDAAQTNSALLPTVVYPAPLAGLPAIRFNGLQSPGQGDFLQSDANLRISNAMTAFMLYEMNSDSPSEQMPFLFGQPNIDGAARGEWVPNGQMALATWADDYYTGFVIPTNTYRIWTDEFNTNLSTLQLFDNTPFSSTNFTFNAGGESPPAAGFYVGGMNPAETAGRDFGGDIAEIILYQGALSTADRLAVVNYLKQKYLNVNGPGLSYQWFFNGAAVGGATNAALVLTNVQPSNGGSYTVIASNTLGSVTSSVASVTVSIPPSFTLQPLSQSNGIGNNITLTGAASGTLPLSYQWQLNNVNLLNATNASLSITNIQTKNAGTYRLIATSPYGAAISSNAVLSVVTSAIQVINVSAFGAQTVSVPIVLFSGSNENSVNFSLDYSNAVLTYAGASLGSNASGAFLFVNTSQTAVGHVGLEIEWLGSGTFALGPRQIALVNFTMAPITNALTTTLAFGSSPTSEQVLNQNQAILPVTFTAGTVAIASTQWEGDVTRRTNGDGFLEINDWLQEGRFVSGLDTISNANEFQRADTAPRATGGDGLLTVADWVQVGRYADGTDLLQLISGPSQPVGSFTNAPSATRIISLAPLVQNAANSSVAVQMTAQGNENAAGFSVAFDPAKVTLTGAAAGSGAAGAAVNVNTNLAANGLVGIAMAFPPGATFAPGTLQLAQLNFSSVMYSNTASLQFAGAPVICQVADTNAAPQPVTFENGALAAGGASWPELSVAWSGTNVVLSWPSAASALQLQSTSSLDAPWSNVLAAPVMSGSSLVVTSAISTNSVFFRLKQ